MFRDLAATGRSRLALFGARVTGAWAIVLPILAATAAALGGLSIALAGSAAAPGRRRARSPAPPRVLAAGALSTAMAVGLSALVGSRGPVIGDPARVLPGDPAAAGRDRLPRRRAPGHPGASRSTGSAHLAGAPARADRARHRDRRDDRLGRRRRSGSAHGRPRRARSDRTRHRAGDTLTRVPGPSHVVGQPAGARRSTCCVTVVVGVPIVATAARERVRHDKPRAGRGRSGSRRRCRCWSGAAGRSPCSPRSSRRRCSPPGRPAVRAPADGRALHDRRQPLVGGDDRAPPAPSSPTALAYALAGGTRFGTGDVVAHRPAVRDRRRHRALHRQQAHEHRHARGAGRAPGARARAARRARGRRGARADRAGAARRGRAQREPDRRAGAGARRDRRRRARHGRHRRDRRPRPPDDGRDAPHAAAAARARRRARSSRRSPGSPTSTSSWRARARPACTSSSRSRARRAGSPRASTCRPSGSCRRR